MSAVLSPLDAVASYGESPSAFLALNEGNEYFAEPGLSGSIAYRKAGRYLIQVAEPFAPEEERPQLLAAFLSFARKLGSCVVAVQLQRHVAELYAEHGFVVNQIGASYIVDLAQFSLRGKKFVRLRNKISRATRCGLEITEADPVDIGEELDEIDLLWLRGKGRFTKELQLLIGERTGAYQGRRRLWVGRIDGRIVAYVSYSPVYGPWAGWLHDLTRRRPDAPPGVMEAIVSTSIDVMRAEGCGWFHLGFTPFTGLDPAHELPTAKRAMTTFMRFMAEHGEKVYPAGKQLEYKGKWAPHVVLPEYVAFQDRLRVGAVWKLLRVTNSI